jgi:two-component system, chemotaxis family, response regulator Rcp1
MTWQILLVEDSPGDVRLTREALRETIDALQIHVVIDGVEAIQFLKREDDYVNAPRPDIILLDLNLPKMDGREVLNLIKSDDNWKSIPTIILTTSDAETDIARCYQLHANTYLCKPVLFEAFERLVKSVTQYWLTEAKLPKSDT